MRAEDRIERIREALRAAFPGSELAIEDQSHQHRGHAGATTGLGHFSLVIVAPAFAGRSPLERHRMVYAAMGALMRTDIHALSIDARSPDEHAP